MYYFLNNFFKNNAIISLKAQFDSFDAENILKTFNLTFKIFKVST